MIRGKYNLAAVIVLTVGLVSAQACTVSIGELALWSGGSIGTGNNATITGTSASKIAINLNKGTSAGSIYTAGSIWLGNNVTVTGDATAKWGITKSKGTVITGSSSSFSDFSLPKLDILSRPSTGTNYIYAGSNSSKTLSPGEYSGWNFSNSTTVNLTSGSYNLSSFWAGNGSVVNIDTTSGDVVLNVVGNFSVGSGVKFVSSGSGTLRVNVFNSDAWLDNNVNIKGDIRVYGGGLTTGSSVNLTGSVYATGDIYLGNDSDVTYASTSTSIPEPSTIVLFTASAMVFIARRRGATNTSAAA
jgi:cytoskeletal protein CcmA (bactofilin family)